MPSIGATIDPASQAGSWGFRVDLQALRALAVILVVLNHTFDTPMGGFVGVDVFYVISGYLITSLLLREFRATGRISFVEFYRRRIKRIVPVAVLVLVVTVAVSYLIWFRPRADQIALDAGAAALFAANWHFIAMDTSYLDSDGLVSPVQHYWSLAIEEQFYVVWPVALLLLLLLAIRWRRRRGMPVALGGTRLVVVALSVLVLASFAWAVQGGIEAPDAVYFDTFARAWELGVGCLLAFLPRHRLRGVVGPLLSTLGLLGIILSAVLISPADPFPGPWALPVVLATALVIWAGDPRRDSALGRVLGLGPVQYIGRISFSLYLWHFPVLLFVGAWLGYTALGVTQTLALAIMIVASALSFQFVEEPFRRARWGRLPPGARHRPVAEWFAVGTAVVVIGATTLGQVSGPRYLVSASDLRSQFGLVQDARFADTDFRWSSDELQQAIDLAVSDPAWEPTALAAYDLDDTTLAPVLHEPCLNVDSYFDSDYVEWQICDYGDPDGEHVAWVVGDSVALSWLPGIAGALGPAGWRVRAIAVPGCPFSTVPVGEYCDIGRDQMFDQIRDADLVIAGSAEWGFWDVADDWEDGTEISIQRIATLGVPLVILSNPPQGLDPVECLSRIASPSTCLSSISEAHIYKRIAERTAVLAQAATGTDVRYVDTTDWFCADDLCPLVIGDLPVRADIEHLTGAMSASLSDLLAAQLDR